MNFRVVSGLELNLFMPVFKKSHKALLSNFYSASDDSNYEMIELTDSVIIRRSVHDFYRLYVCSSNLKELKDALLELKDNTYIINIPTKKTIDDWKDLFNGTGFDYLARYDRYFNTQIEQRDSEIGQTALSNDIEGIYNLIYCGQFSEYTDYLPSREELTKMIDNNQIIVNKDGEKVLGVIIYTIEGKKCYINLWIDRSGEGLFLLFDVYNIMVEQGIKASYFWVDSLNKKVIKIHKLTGAVPDGISDYTFIKK